MLQPAGSQSPENSTWLHPAVACIEPARLLPQTSPPNYVCFGPVLNTSELTVPGHDLHPIAEGGGMPGSSWEPGPN